MNLEAVFIVFLAYIFGSIPFGLIIVKIFTGKNITKIGSGRTGGTNAMRAGGVVLGLLTSIFDVGKGFVVVFVVKLLYPELFWLHVFAGVSVVLGHNWSIFLFILNHAFSAGAGTGPNIGASIALWPMIGLIVTPMVPIIIGVLGFASVASITVAISIPLIFYLRSTLSTGPSEYIVFGILTAILVAVSLLPNIRRLLKGTEKKARFGSEAKAGENYNSTVD